MQDSKFLTKHLLSLATPYASATTHSFLAAAGNGSLSHNLLSFWLYQDRIYAAQAYPKFIGSLISNIPFDPAHGLSSPEENLNKRILKILLFALENIVRESSFFQETAQKWGLKLEGWPERKGTRDYTAEMERMSKNWIDGLVFLWAMEKSRLAPGKSSSDSRTNAAIATLSENWTCPEFVAFVDDLSGLVDSLGIEPESAEWKRAEKVWARVVELEANFWPMEEEIQHI
ncbi:heme oxygenase-like protein [Gymnopus androsaceus JB14]|uniref:Heme oxygenase-like protein n=1 Tax=Gymnopus androsaceus JB14 TaxID=1447944 RepID=A0A6A4I3R7_9AGAR|nr:heme oxygenase-like protein [Gymnopus androsaceus JB14]